MMSAIRTARAAALLTVAAFLGLPPGAAAADGAASPAASGSACNGELGPVEMVCQTSNRVLDLIDKAQGYAKEDPERFYGEVESLLSPVVDFESFARSVMASYYRQATPEQRRRFAETFKWGLVRTYALALTDFKDGEVVVVPPDRPPRNPKRQTVKMEIHTDTGEVYPVLYSVTQDDEGKWQIRNLIVNGVNMGLTYRNQFNSAMHDPKYGGDLDKVIDAWGGLLKSETDDANASESQGEQQA